MPLEALIDRIEAGESPRHVLRERSAGVSAAYFERVRLACAADPARASRLAGHWRAFLIHGDEPALAHRAKGVAERLRGRWLASARAFEKAGQTAADDLGRLTYPIGGVDGLAKAARVDEAVALGARLAAGLDDLGEPALAARARLNAANALLAAERGAEARRLYAAAIPAFVEAGFAMEEAMARLGLSTTHLYGGDPAVSGREAAAARDLAASLGLDYLAALCEMNLAHAAIVSGRADEAFADLRLLRPRLAGNPSDAARLEESIGDACLSLNLLDEAAEAYGAALAARDGLPAVDRAHVRLGLGETLARTDPDGAHRHLAHAQRGYRALGNPHWRAAATAARVECHPKHPHALRRAREACQDAKGSPYHESLAGLALACALIERGADPAQALRKVRRRVRKYGFRRFAWRIHALQARAASAPLPHYRRMMAEILRDRLATTSVAARAGFLRDKSEAVGRYLAHLLSHPTPRRVAEAGEAIRRTRAATLLDEILRSGTLTLDPAQTARLEALRVELVREAAEGGTPDARAAVATRPAARGWTEATHVLGALDAVVPPGTDERTVVLAEADGRLWALVEGRAVPLGLSSSELRGALRWLEFELDAPTAHRDAPCEEAHRILRELRGALVDPWRPRDARPIRVCPDGLLWRVPWDALVEDGATILLHPSFAGGRRVGAVERVALWIDAAADLPNAPAEERTLMTCFPQARIMRSRAEVLGSLAESWDLVHVVGHARHNAGNPMFSSLEFADGPLYAAEIARSGLRTRLACLSACETGVLSLANRSEPDGLVRAFLARGSEAVLASLWPLDDEAASRFFSSLYNDLCPITPLPEAVGKARRSVRAWRDHPYFWASLSLFGGYLT